MVKKSLDQPLKKNDLIRTSNDLKCTFSVELCMVPCMSNELHIVLAAYEPCCICFQEAIVHESELFSLLVNGIYHQDLSVDCSSGKYWLLYTRWCQLTIE